MEAAEHVDCQQAQDDDQRGQRHYRCDLPRHAHAMIMRQNSITENQARTQLSDLTAFAHEDLEAQLKTPPRLFPGRWAFFAFQGDRCVGRHAGRR